MPFTDQPYDLRADGWLGRLHVQGAEQIQVVDRPLLDVRLRLDGSAPKK